jgi:hypothetical protein
MGRRGAFGPEATTLINLGSSVPANTTSPLFSVIGTEFYHEVSGAQYRWKNGSFIALSNVKVSAV